MLKPAFWTWVIACAVDRYETAPNIPKNYFEPNRNNGLPSQIDPYSASHNRNKAKKAQFLFVVYGILVLNSM